MALLAYNCWEESFPPLTQAAVPPFGWHIPSVWKSFRKPSKSAAFLIVTNLQMLISIFKTFSVEAIRETWPDEMRAISQQKAKKTFSATVRLEFFKIVCSDAFLQSTQ